MRASFNHAQQFDFPFSCDGALLSRWAPSGCVAKARTGPQPVGVAKRFSQVPWQIGHHIRGAFWWHRLGVGREEIKANAQALAIDHLADEAGLRFPVGKGPLERTPSGVTDALTRREPHAVIGANRQNVPEVSFFQFRDKRGTLAIDTVCQHNIKLRIPRLAVPS